MVCKRRLHGIPRRSVRKAAGRRKRFCPPEEPACWEGVYKADHFGCVCPQTEHEPDSFYGKEFYLDPEFGMNQSEDCLYLNIWTPANAADEKLPVAFWIHGGAFMHGFSHESEFDGVAYCERGVILVTINYRLGAFGFWHIRGCLRRAVSEEAETTRFSTRSQH